MTEDSRCLGQKKMMGRGAEGGCGTEEKPYPVTKISPPAKTPAPASLPEKLECEHLGVDFYSQALKALSERSPFDSDEVLANTVATLPSGLASLLSRPADHKKKHKRPHSETKSSRKGSNDKSKSSRVWIELEEYFRELTMQDIGRLYQFSSSFRSLLNSSNSCFKIPVLGNGIRSISNHDNISQVENGHAEDFPAAATKEEDILDDDVPMSDAVVLEDKVEEVDKENDKLQDVKIEDGSRDSLSVVEEGPLPEYASQACSSVEWVLGSRSRALLTTTRPSKKRKFLGGSAGLERLNVAQPCDGSSSLCHVCSLGETSDQLNQLVVCKSCTVVVHQKCYGVQGEIDGSWLCSWCKHKIDTQAAPTSGSDRPCVLCPKSGGALKRFENSDNGNGGSVEFAHLFCSMWIPEVYIDDTRLMEPVLCHGLKDIRGKLVCNLCKVKVGSCIRCSDGSCRTSFHPMCAREARNKLEIWGKFGCDDFELRAFCAKHSGNCNVADSVTLESSALSHAVGSDSLGSLLESAIPPGNKIKKLKIGCKNGDKVTLHMGSADAISDNLREIEWQDKGLINADTYTKVKEGSGDGQELSGMGLEGTGEDVKTSCLLDLGLVLKKLVERGKVSLEQISTDIGISETSLLSKLTDNHLSSELSCKILKWLKDHAHMETSEKDWSAKLSCFLPSKAEVKTDDSCDAVGVKGLNISDVPVKSVPPRRRTVGNIRILKEEKATSLWNNKMRGNGVSTNEGTDSVDRDNSSKDSILHVTEEIMVETNDFEQTLTEPSHTYGSVLPKPIAPCDEHDGAEEGTSSGKSSLLDLDQETPSCSSVDMAGRFDGNIDVGIESAVHPYIQKKLDEVQGWLIRRTPDCSGFVELGSFAMEQTLSSKQNLPVSVEQGGGSEVAKLEDMHKTDDICAFDPSPENEVEGEIIFFQQQLLRNAVALKHQSDQLVSKIVRDLPHEMDSVRKRRWDSVHVNQYIYELKEARKQGRKERRHKEAQAVLAAATAAAAASSRVSSLRKDAVDEFPQLENQSEDIAKVRGGLLSLSVPRAKAFNPTLDVVKATSDGFSGTPKEHSKICDICRRSESILNPILVCLSCKVAVHLNCYRSVKESTGPWYCEFCEESSSLKVSRSSLAKSLETPNFSEECGLCGAPNGALRKSSNGQWVHAFCAEWVFDSTFRRGQVSAVAGMDTVQKGNDLCSVCERRYGVCIKCYYGNCQATFHPSCARNDGYYLYTKYIGGGKMQHKAYCSKHSLEQRAKAETQKHGVEDLKIVKQHRVELEKLRLLCERIVKREKLKRELVLCNQDIFASKRDSLVYSMLVHRSFSSHESSDSATTSLMGHVDGSRSCSDAMQRSDDITVDSALSGKRCIRLPQSIENDQKAEVSSSSHHLPTPKSTDRVSFAGKQIPIRAALSSRNFTHSLENRLKSKKQQIETLEKELVMTSDQASMKNRRLPKGYFYVPLDYVSNGKPVSRNSVEKEEVDD